MQLPINTFKRDLNRTPAMLGTWLSTGATSTAEALGFVGYDFLVVDMEHAPVDTPQMIELLRAIAGTPAAALTRIPWNDTVMVKRALDAGAQSLMFPFVQNADEAARAVAATRYPPLGIRGVSTSNRANRYAKVGSYLQSATDEICVVLQIETAQAVDNIASIAKVAGVDSLFLGPSDLSASMGALGNPNDERVQSKLKEAAAICRSLGISAGVLAPNPHVAAGYLSYGYSWVAIGSDMGMMVTRANEWLGTMRPNS